MGEQGLRSRCGIGDRHPAEVYDQRETQEPTQGLDCLRQLRQQSWISLVI
ncbi:hypothetical protein MC7420_7518 [Coleofasciculus chthonoplastes PCC 7420]|uniref:Uncharacterized protein n=1 Tax=Coleofasciculus chthonoplastes PCC 7420 TaxID=118168 RepID=B4W1A5_9CYAN|nr:hypothetical protein MC7420_7518 [Coleofasciculus chthonoplastes PCC 7420]